MGLLKDLGKGILIEVIVIIVVYFISTIANYFGVGYPFNLLLLEYPLWITAVAIILLIPIVVMLARRKRPSPHIGVLPRRPDYNVVVGSYMMYGVRWKFLYGQSSRLSDPYVFVESRPYCHPCDFKMDVDKKGLFLKKFYWKCERCGEFYECPKGKQFTADEVVERMIESDIASGRIRFNEES